VTVVAHHDSPIGRVRHLAAETAPTAIVTSAGRVGLEPLGPAIRHRLHVDRAPDELSGWHSIDRLVAEHDPLIEPVPRADRDVAAIMYSSGTTGTPRGFVRRHGELSAQIQRLHTASSPEWPSVNYLAVLPMSSGFGSGPFSYGLTRRSTVYFLDRDHFEPEHVLAAIEKHRIERTCLVPAMCEALLAVPAAGRCDVSSLRKVFVGGAYTPPDLIDRFLAKFGTGVAIQIQYGLSGIGVVSKTSPDSSRGSAGRLNPDFEARVIDPEGREVAAGAIGELVLSKKSGAAADYWSLESSAAGASEWFPTGDLVRFSPDGDLYVVGRTDDLIIQGGHNIHGQAAAEVVQRLAGVRECAVVGVPTNTSATRPSPAWRSKTAPG
jgi:acyl-CoA synthetase (AMP-forming)/AMP-acid ligase II